MKDYETSHSVAFALLIHFIREKSKMFFGIPVTMCELDDENFHGRTPATSRSVFLSGGNYLIWLVVNT